MAIYNREDPRTALPQLEKSLNDRIDKTQEITEISPTANYCSKGTANACYKMGKIVFLSFNINITSSGIAMAYLKGLPKPIHNMACCSNTARFRVDTSGELVSEESPSTGWHNGSIVYLTKEK